MTSPPKVSVCIITYNHAKYIEQALVSALTQRTNFEFEVIVSDDASTDGTADIIRRVAMRFPRLKAMLHVKNLGGSGQENYLKVHNAALGEYVAHLDGDDYWLPGKLMAQARILDAHPECSVAWHPMIAFEESGNHHIIGNHGNLVRQLFGKDNVELGDAMVAYGITGFHSSCMYRRSARTLREYPINEVLLDYRISLSLLERGAGYHMRRALGCYRAFHDNSATRGGKDIVGPGLLRALADYSASHPELKHLIGAHCTASFVSRSRFQGRLLALLFARLREARETSSRSGDHTSQTVVRGSQSLSLIARNQWLYTLNSLRLLKLAARQRKLPEARGVVRAVKVADYLGGAKASKPGFFARKYGPRFGT